MRRVRKILLAAMLLACVLALTSCGKTKVDLQEYTTIEFDGLDTRAKIDLDVDEETLALAILGDIPESEAAQWTYAQKTILLGCAFEYEATPCENLSNGDVVTITVYPDEAVMEELEIAVKQTEWKVTVEGLAEGKKVDLFKDVVVSFRGVNGDGSVIECYNSSDDPFISGVRFAYGVDDKVGQLSNGDKILVIASCDERWAEEQGYLLPDSMKKEFEVTGLGEWLVDSKQVTEAVLQHAWDLARQERSAIGTSTIPEAAYLLMYKADEYEKSSTYATSVVAFIYASDAAYEPYEAFVIENPIIVEDESLQVGLGVGRHSESRYNSVGAEFDGNTLEEVKAEMLGGYTRFAGEFRYSLIELDCSQLK